MILAKGLTAILLAVIAGWLLQDAFVGAAVGRPLVLDGDTLEFDGERIDLWGIDAPEFEQTCTAGGTEWACGAFAYANLVTRLGQGGVWCLPRGYDGQYVPRAQCFQGFTDVGGASVAQGWASAANSMTDAYGSDEARARHETRGLWRRDGASR